jgi:hypothetical protein
MAIWGGFPVALLEDNYTQNFIENLRAGGFFTLEGRRQLVVGLPMKSNGIFSIPKVIQTREFRVKLLFCEKNEKRHRRIVCGFEGNRLPTFVYQENGLVKTKERIIYILGEQLVTITFDILSSAVVEIQVAKNWIERAGLEFQMKSVEIHRGLADNWPNSPYQQIINEVMSSGREK